jgi:hypothetical protein
MDDGCQDKSRFDSSLKRNMSQEQIYPPVFLAGLTPLLLEILSLVEGLKILLVPP